MVDKVYLGDSVYAEIESGMIRLTTDNGMGASNEIFLEMEVYRALLRWFDMIRDREAQRNEQV